MLARLKRLGMRLSLDHHSQGLLLGLGVLFVVVWAWWSLLGLVVYAVMHFQYGGAGTFQHPPRENDNPATVADLLYVLIGVGGLILIVLGMAKRIIEVFR